MKRAHTILKNEGARLTRICSLETLAIAGLPGADIDPHSFYDACEDTWPDVRIERGGAKEEIGYILLTEDEAELQDRLDQAIVNDYYESELETEEFMDTPALGKIRRLARQLVTRMLEDRATNMMQHEEWEKVRSRVTQTLRDFPDPDA
ncbi:MAG: hypothetical protein QOJ65_1341 [Fimbriimonadaceae bacterium]|jgi:hypothetical protein|nr:hypothetical protein [Fimbriimonadaceae bacterium]